MSGDQESCYEYEERFVYEDNEIGNSLLTNEGFDIRPLDEELFGKKAAEISHKKHNIKKQKELQRQKEEKARIELE